MNAAFKDIKSVLVVLSSAAQGFDMAAFRKLITHAYPGAAVFFISISGDAVGVEGPNKVDLVIDFTQPGARQRMGFARSMRSRGRHVVGRNAGWFVRRKSYYRVFDEKKDAGRPKDFNDFEVWASTGTRWRPFDSSRGSHPGSKQRNRPRIAESVI